SRRPWRAAALSTQNHRAAARSTPISSSSSCSSLLRLLPRDFRRPRRILLGSARDPHDESSNKMSDDDARFRSDGALSASLAPASFRPRASAPPSETGRDIAGEDFLFHLYRGSELLQD